MSGVLATRTITACPSWCEEPAGHRNADDDPFEEPMVRTHVGRIGKFEISVTEGHSEVELARWRRKYGAEKVAELMTPTVDLVLTTSGPEVESPADLRQLAADALKAAEWLESQQ